MMVIGQRCKEISESVEVEGEVKERGWNLGRA